MKALIQVGGQGTRMRPISFEIPKPLIPVKKKPIVNHLIELFARHGVSEVGLLASRDHEEDFIRWQKTWDDELAGKKISIFYEEKPSGTFGWLKHFRDWFGHESFAFANGDNILDVDVAALRDFHNAHKPVGTIALVKADDPRKYGVPVLEGHRITEFLEKPENPPSNYISAGLYVLEPAVFDYADFSKDYLMIEGDVFPKLAKDGKLYGMKMEPGRWYDCGTLEGWEKAIREW